jgi:predicted phage terminase large subunit-like protein
MQIAETVREKKDRLRLSHQLLTTLTMDVESCLSRAERLSLASYNRLKALSGSEDFNTQMATLEALTEQCEAELIETWVILARDNYHDFYEFMARDEGDDGMGYTMSPHQRLIGDLLMESERKETMRFMLSMPPGHCKSTHSSHHFPAYYFGKNPRKIFLQAGHSQDFVAKELGAKVRGIIDSDDYRLVFPHIKMRSDMRAMDYWGLSNKKGKYVAKGVGQGISGFRGHYGMVDDPYKSRKDAESPTIRETAFKWYSDDFSTRLLPGSPLGIIMTRWHSDDLCGRITDREEKEARELFEKQQNDLRLNIEQNEGLSSKYRFKIINLPAIAEEENDPLGRAPGEPLWDEVFNLAALENLRADMTGSSWNSLYQGTPIDVSGGTIMADWFKRYQHPPTKGDPELKQQNQIKRITVSVDAANTVKERSDFTVIGVWIEDFHKNHYLIDVIREKMELTALVSKIDYVCKRYEADALLVEAKGNGLAYVQLKANGGAPCPLVSIEVGTASKAFRFDEVSPMFEGGLVYLPERAGWLADYEKELVAFPNGKNDDQVDMTSQYLKWCKGKQRRGSKKMVGAGYSGR